GSYTLTSWGGDDGFILRMDQSGTVLWATSFGSTDANSNESAGTITVDDNGNCYTASTFKYDCNYVGGPALQTNSTRNVMLCCWDNSGSFLWAKAVRGGESPKFSLVTLSILVEENVLLIGTFAGI